MTQAIATLQELKAPPVKYALLMDDDEAVRFADGGWGARGALTLAHEALSGRLYREASGGTLASGMAPPIMGFSQVVQLHLAGEDTHIIHQRPGYTDADAVIHFEGNGILSLGPVFTSDGFPRIDAARGGKMSSMIETVDYFVTAFSQRPAAIEPVIPGRGPIATLADLRDYRDMLRTVQDRVQALRQDRQAAPGCPRREADRGVRREVGTRTSHRRAVRYDGVRSRQQAITMFESVAKFGILCLFLL